VDETWVQLSAGRGPTECCWVVARIAERLRAEAAASAVKVEEIELEPGPEPGTLRSALLHSSVGMPCAYSKGRRSKRANNLCNREK
jgi:protein subunit release factor B